MATGGIYSISVTTDKRYKAIVNRLLKAGAVDIQAAVNETVYRLRRAIVTILQIQFQNAYLRSPEAFPIAYIIQLLAVAERLPVEVNQSGFSFTVAFNLGDLGDEEELEHGYHYGASLARGGTVTLPYGSATLKNDVAVRYLFWQTLRFNSTYKGRPLDESLWNDTISARVSYWNSIQKAPQWLLLQYGQTTYAPTNEPFPIVENTRELIKRLGTGIFANELIKQYNNMRQSLGQEIGYPQDLMKLSEFLVGSTETDYLSPSEAASKGAKMPSLLKSHTVAAINAKTNEDVLGMLIRLTSLEGTDIDLLIKNWSTDI